MIPKKYKKIFVTGGAGFIGSHVADLLVADGRDVTVFDNLTSGNKDFLKKCIGKKNFTLIHGDMMNPEDIAMGLSHDTDLVMHLVANPDISKGVKNPKLDFDQTINVTFNLLQVMRKKSVKNLVYFSGSGVYGDLGDTFSKESHGPLLPVSMYGAAKLSAEALISAFCHLFEVRAWIFRPANIIGGRATHGVILDFMTRLERDPTTLLILGDGNQSKSYIHVSDVIDAVFLAVNKATDKINIFNIASRSFITVNEIAGVTIRGMGIHPRHVRIEHTAGKVGWPGDVPKVRIDSTKLRKLGWREKHSSKKAVERTVADLLKDRRKTLI